MKLIARDSDYAVRALVFMLKNKDEVISVSELVSKLKLPRPFLRKTLQALSRKGYIKSFKGSGGGFKLKGSPAKLTLYKILEAFQGSIRLNECLFKKMACPNIKKCALKRKIAAIEKDVISKLKAITLVSLIQTQQIPRHKG